MMPVVFEIGPIPIYGYGLMLALAFAVGYWQLGWGLRREGLEPGLAGPITVLAVVCGVWGAKGLWLLGRWEAVWADPLGALAGPGMTFHGGLAAATAAIFCYVRWRRVGFSRVLDAAAPALMIAYGIGRLGCHLAGDGDYGVPTSLPWGVDYSRGVVPPSQALAGLPEIAAWYPGGVVPDATPLHPTPLYECLLAVVGFLVLRRVSGRGRAPGWRFAVYLGLSGVCRFGVEFVRLNPRVGLGLTEAQLISLGLIGLAVVGGVWLGRRPVAATSAGPGLPAGEGPRRRSVVLAELAGVLLTSQIGCVGTEHLDVTGLKLSGVAYEPTFVRNPAQNNNMALPRSRTYWVLEGPAADAGQEFLLRWDNVLFTLKREDLPDELTCDFCQNLRAGTGCFNPTNDPTEIYVFPPDQTPKIRLFGVPLRDEAMGSVDELTRDAQWDWDRSCNGNGLPKEALFRATADRAYEARLTFENGNAPDDDPRRLQVHVVPQAGSRAMPLRKVGQHTSPTLWRFPPTDLDGELMPGEEVEEVEEMFDPELRVCDVRMWATRDTAGTLVKVREWRPYQVSVHARAITSPRFQHCVGKPDDRGGIIDMSRCFHDDGNVFTQEPTAPVTPLYQVGSNLRLFWVIEYQDPFPAPPMPDRDRGEALAIEFWLRGAAGNCGP